VHSWSKMAVDSLSAEQVPVNGIIVEVDFGAGNLTGFRNKSDF